MKSEGRRDKKATRKEDRDRNVDKKSCKTTTLQKGFMSSSPYS